MDRIRKFGVLCMVAAVVWILAISIEYPLQLQPPGIGFMFHLNQTMFLIANTGFLIGIIGLIWSRAAGDGWFGKIALGLFALGYAAIIIATMLGLFAGKHDSVLFPVGGITASLACLLSGIAVVSAKHWKGWQRWSVLFYAIYYWVALFLPLVIANQEPNQLTETIWGLCWFLIGFALYTGHQRREYVAL